MMKIPKNLTIFAGKFPITNFSGKKSSKVQKIQDFYKKLAQLGTAFKDALAGTNVLSFFLVFYYLQRQLLEVEK